MLKCHLDSLAVSTYVPKLICKHTLQSVTNIYTIYLYNTNKTTLIYIYIIYICLSVCTLFMILKSSSHIWWDHTYTNIQYHCYCVHIYHHLHDDYCKLWWQQGHLKIVYCVTDCHSIPVSTNHVHIGNNNIHSATNYVFVVNRRYR